MEATGIYWKPVYAVIEDDFEVIVCNAHHISNVPERKTVHTHDTRSANPCECVRLGSSRT